MPICGERRMASELSGRDTRWTLNGGNRVDHLLQSALERRPAERDNFLLQACGGDEALEQEVRL